MTKMLIGVAKKEMQQLCVGTTQALSKTSSRELQPSELLTYSRKQRVF